MPLRFYDAFSGISGASAGAIMAGCNLVRLRWELNYRRQNYAPLRHEHRRPGGVHHHRHGPSSVAGRCA
eukprot:5151952-Prymnesium_polylepis.1